MPAEAANPRTLVVWCPDWPVTAAGIVDGVPTFAPVAVFAANRVVAASTAARAEGVRRGLRKREAQSRCPQLVAVAYDPARDVRAFEPVVAAVEALAPGVEVLRAGVCALGARGPSAYFGGEARAAERIVEHVAVACGVESQVGAADGVFAAVLAARAGQLVPVGGSARFLADLDISTLDRPQLTGLLRRLGIRSLGGFAALPAADVLARFGFDAAYAHRLAAGRDTRPLAVRRPPPDLDVAETFDEPLERVDVAAFASRALARRLHERLAGHGLACTRLGIEAVTAHGEELHRTWRHDGLLTEAAIADRVRWQLDGWLTRAARTGQGAPTAGILRLRLVPDGMLTHVGLQPGLWGEAGRQRDRAGRAIARVQGILGPEAVVTAVLTGGRSPGDQVRLVRWGDDRGAGQSDRGDGRSDRGDGQGGDRGHGARTRAGRSAPWPGRLPGPAPAVVLPEPLPAVVGDEAGGVVGVNGRLAVSAPPAWVSVDRAAPVEVVAWAGPWPVDERWWAAAQARRGARFQLCLADGRALLMLLSAGHWVVEAIYD
ncbi:MAG TPA: DNA polymerase Y family protein [Micromonosporaceae bacterium]|nr:DNA polymerase Y family protein [Micromonosporaceae bacterium]